jgi:hypothetical protein
MLLEAQRFQTKKALESLMVEKKTVKGILGTECNTMMVCVRARKIL